MAIDTQLYSISEKLDRIEEWIKNRQSKTWLAVSDVKDMTGLSRSTIARGIKSTRLKSVKNNGKLMFRREWLDRWIQGH